MGPTGTGKTMTISDKLTRKMPKEYIPDFIVFSAKTSANQTQDLIDGKLDKRSEHANYYSCLCRIQLLISDVLEAMFGYTVLNISSLCLSMP